MKSYIWITHEGKSALEHVVIASKALGKPLPDGAEVHHVDGDKQNNKNSNLVICPTTSYHRLIHTRTKALEATGNPNSKKCWICKRWDEIKNLRGRSKVKEGQFEHAECNRQYQYERYRIRKNAS